MKRYYDNDGTPLHEVCGNCKLLKPAKSAGFYCQRTHLFKEFEDSCMYHVMND